MGTTSTDENCVALSREQCRAVDKYAIEQLAIPGIVLMENAGRKAAEFADHCLLDHAATRHLVVTQLEELPVYVVCGRGNNGGDGFVIARQLFNRGRTVRVDLAADPGSLSNDAAVNYEIVKRMGIPMRVLDTPEAIATAAADWQSSGMIVDALLGTGFTGEVREPLAGIIRAINSAADLPIKSPPGPVIISVDVPSGLDVDTGMPGGVAVTAHCTVSLLASKIGYQNHAAHQYLGRLCVADIGAPLDLILSRLGIEQQV